MTNQLLLIINSKKRNEKRYESFFQRLDLAVLFNGAVGSAYYIFTIKTSTPRRRGLSKIKQMILNKIFTSLLSLGIIFGFGIGAVKFVFLPETDWYLQRNMYRWLFYSMRETLNPWILSSAAISIIISIIALLMLLFTKNQNIRLHDKKSSKHGNSLNLLILGLAFIFFLLAIIINIGVFLDSQIFVTREPNILLITMDAVRADHLPCYGYDRDTTPNISNYAKRGIIFEKAISQSSWTKASMASLFSSTYPHNHKALSWKDVLPQDILTLAEVLKQSGYYTVGFQSNPYINSSLNFDQGFDVYKFCTHKLKQGKRLIEHFLKKSAIENHSKFFAYIHLMDVHLPYNPPKVYCKKFDTGYKGKLEKYFFSRRREIIDGTLKLSDEDKEHIITLYDAEINYLDDQIDNLLTALNQMNLLHKTIIIIHADHGEEFWDHGGYEHGHTMYNELLNVPLIIIPPKFKEKNFRISSTVRLIDLFPTLLGMLGIEMPSGIMGKDLSRDILDKNKKFELPAFSEAIVYGEEKKAIQTDNFKLIKNCDSDTYEFYYLSEDAPERKQVYSSKYHAEFEKLLTTYIQMKTNMNYKKQERDFDPETLDELKSLGYLE